MLTIYLNRKEKMFEFKEIFVQTFIFRTNLRDKDDATNLISFLDFILRNIVEM